MAVLLVSFAIEWDNQASFDRLWHAIHRAVTTTVGSKRRVERLHWAETTSFYIVETNETPGVFLGRVWRAAGMRQTKDRLLVLDVDVGDGAFKGKNDNLYLYGLLPFVENHNERLSESPADGAQKFTRRKAARPTKGQATPIGSSTRSSPPSRFKPQAAPLPAAGRSRGRAM